MRCRRLFSSSNLRKAVNKTGTVGYYHRTDAWHNPAVFCTSVLGTDRQMCTLSPRFLILFAFKKSK